MFIDVFVAMSCEGTGVSKQPRIACHSKWLARQGEAKIRTFPLEIQNSDAPSNPATTYQQTVRLQVCISLRLHRSRKRTLSNKRFFLIFRTFYGNPPTATMSHESVWYSRPRTYGKGSREWCVYTLRSQSQARGTLKRKRRNILVSSALTSEGITQPPERTSR